MDIKKEMELVKEIILLRNELAKSKSTTPTPQNIEKSHHVQEISLLYETLQKYNEELEQTNEELTATNEELVATEEELRSQYEELQVSREALAAANRRLTDIIEFLPDPTFVVDQNKKVVAWNKALEEFTGLPKEAVLGKDNSYWKPFHQEPGHMLVDKVIKNYLKQLNSGQPIDIQEYKLVTEAYMPQLNQGNGAYIWIKSSPLFDEHGNFAGAIETLRDISHIKRTEKKVQEQLNFLQLLMDTIPSPIFYKDVNGIYQGCNKAFEEYTGKQRQAIVGKAVAEAFPYKMADVYIDMDTKLFQQQGTQVYEATVSNTEGKIHDVIFHKATYTDAEGNLAGLVGIITDISERKTTEDTLRFLSLHDPTTNLYNRTYFEESLDKFEEDNTNNPGLMIIDVDGLKLVNDTHGHHAGDKLLKTVADILSQFCHKHGIVARIGGDEFAILFPHTTNLEMEEIRRSIVRLIDRYNLSETQCPISLSLGYAVRDDHNKSMRDLFIEADNLMYRAKLHRSRSTRNSMVQTLMKTLEARDFITEGHTDRLQQIMVAIGKAMGFPYSRIHDLRLLARFHDIGKVGISDAILFKPGQLTSDERAEMQRHSEIGYRIAQSTSDLLPIASWILYHHEWWNGEGYPLGLKGEEIPLECRLLSIVDAYDAMTNNRPYRKAMSHDKAIKIIADCAGIQFDPNLTPLVIKVLIDLNNK